MGLIVAEETHQPDLGQNTLCAWVTTVKVNTNQGAGMTPQARSAEPQNSPQKQGSGPARDFTPVPNPDSKSYGHVKWGGETPVDESKTRNEIIAQYGKNCDGAATAPNFPDPTVGSLNNKPFVEQTVTATKHLPKDVSPSEHARLNAIESKSVKCIQDSVGGAGIRMQKRLDGISDAPTARNVMMQQVKEALRTEMIESGCWGRADMMGGNSRP